MHPKLPSAALLWLASIATAYLVPDPPGKYNVTLTTGPLTDYSRNDPYAPSPTPRALMLSVFQPAVCNTTESVPYMPAKVAELQGTYIEDYFNISFNITPFFLGAELPVCPLRRLASESLQREDCRALWDDAGHEFPVLLFSPGYAIPRFYYNYLASALASTGMTVITMDHPYGESVPDS